MYSIVTVLSIVKSVIDCGLSGVVVFNLKTLPQNSIDIHYQMLFSLKQETEVWFD